MSKLSESQKRALRVMWQYKICVGVCIWGNRLTVGWFADANSMPTVAISTRQRPRMQPPNLRTMQSLEHLGLLKREAESAFNFRFVLTPKGREMAEELEEQ